MPQLVILAAGMGSRFGGLKQLEPVDDKGNFIIDYSIYDAVRAGFDKVTFVIKEENLDAFRDTIGSRIENKINVDYVFQDTKKFVPEQFKDCGRQKPWGTAHAVLCAKDAVDDNFAMINADDFYGRETFEKAAEFLNNNKDDNCFGMVGFKAKNTLSENGAVKRGVVDLKKGKLTGITECNVEKVNGVTIAKPLEKGEPRIISPDALVSMNIFGFTPKIFNYLEDGFPKFIKEHSGDLSKCEYLIPEVVTKFVTQGDGEVKVLDTNSQWIGMTYRADMPGVVNKIKLLREQGEYPEDLWGKSQFQNGESEEMTVVDNAVATNQDLTE